MIMAKKIGATISIKGERIVENSPEKNRRKAIEVLVQKINEEVHADEVRVVVVGGCVEAGKSSLIGVLTQGEMDNGKGKFFNYNMFIITFVLHFRSSTTEFVSPSP